MRQSKRFPVSCSSQNSVSSKEQILKYEHWVLGSSSTLAGIWAWYQAFRSKVPRKNLGSSAVAFPVRTTSHRNVHKPKLSWPSSISVMSKDLTTGAGSGSVVPPKQRLPLILSFSIVESKKCWNLCWHEIKPEYNTPASFSSWKYKNIHR